MTTWQTLALVIRRELIERGKTKALLFSSLFTILLLIGSIALPVFLGQRAQTFEVGVLGSGNEAIIDAAFALGNAEREEGGVAVNTTEFSTVAALEAAFDEGIVEIGLVDGAERGWC